MHRLAVLDGRDRVVTTQRIANRNQWTFVTKIRRDDEDLRKMVLRCRSSNMIVLQRRPLVLRQR